MDWISLTCRKCGAALEAAEGARYVACSFCKSRLEIVRGPDSVDTKLLDELEKRNAVLERELEAANLHSAIAKLDREWEEERRDYLIWGKEGAGRTPTTAGAVFVAVIGVVNGAAWFYISGRMRSHVFPGVDGPREGLPPFAYFGLVPIAIGLGFGWFILGRAQAHARALSLYRAERGRLEALLRAPG